MQVYLIEINTSPALFRAGKYLTQLLPDVVEEVAQKCIDPNFPPPTGVELPPRMDGFQPVQLVQYSSGGGAGAARAPASKAVSLNRRESGEAAGAVWK